MNKKKLSVVMAGAMLATSVAPVLAATETVVNESERGLLIKRLRELMNSKVFSNLKSNEDLAIDKVSSNYDAPGESVYYVKVNGSIFKLDEMANLERAIQDAEAGTVVEVVDRGHVEKDGKVYNHALEDVVENIKFTKTKLEDIAKEFNDGTAPSKYSDVVYAMSYKDGVLTVEVRTAADESNHVVLTFKDGDNAVDFSKPMNKDDEAIPENNTSEWKNFDHFKVRTKKVAKKDVNLPEKLVEKITLTDVDAKYETVLSKLYDGLFLTEDGEKLLDGLRKYDADKDCYIDETSFGVKDTGRGIYEFTINFYRKIKVNGEVKDTVKQTLVVKSNNKAQLELFVEGLKTKETTCTGIVVRKFPVQKLAGSNRYETAVKVAKENADIRTVAENGNIVLVNGNSLVDGLAAAPLAASVVNAGNTMGGNFVAPILLTDANGLPKVTKDYMKEVIAHQKVGALDKVTVYLVGGETVISPAVANDLKEIGFRVVRAGGEDREATSLKVAKLVANENETTGSKASAFVVGADGEADAMSVAAYAAQEKTPIIVESRKGISDNTVEFLRGHKLSTGKNVAIIGGNTVVSEATEAKLKEEKIETVRIAGADRQSTNAKVISMFYDNHTINHVLVSKDGKGNKGQLIDALTATSIAASKKSPIVLGTNKLTDEQKNAIELKATRVNPVYVYQVGHGVARDVVKSIAERINLSFK